MKERKKMKKLEITLNNCNECPCLVYSDRYFLCGHNDAEGDVSISPAKAGKGFPEWCPIQDQNPGVRVGLTAMIVRNGKILLGERFNTETANGMLAYPGGRMDYGEDPEDGVIREIFEETGLIVSKGTMRYLTFKNEFFPDENKHYVSLIFVATKFEGEPEVKEPEKCKGWDWYDPFDLPENTFWAIKEVIDVNFVYVKTIMVVSENEYERELEGIKDE